MARVVPKNEYPATLCASIPSIHMFAILKKQCGFSVSHSNIIKFWIPTLSTQHWQNHDTTNYADACEPDARNWIQINLVAEIY